LSDVDKKQFDVPTRLDDVDAILNFAQHLREQEDQGALVWMRRAARKGHPLAPWRSAQCFAALDRHNLGLSFWLSMKMTTTRMMMMMIYVNMSMILNLNGHV
jgi:hypothetical protein